MKTCGVVEVELTFKFGSNLGKMFGFTLSPLYSQGTEPPISIRWGDE
jgi:hypothetical protein